MLRLYYKMERREVLQIRPTNQSDGIYSFNGGAPQIEFDIPRVPKYLLGKTLRINGTFEVFMGDGVGAVVGDAAISSQARPQNSINGGSATRQLRLDSRTGVASCIDYVSIANQSGQSFEMIKNYNRLVASLNPKDYDMRDLFCGGMDIISGATGKQDNTGRLCNKPFDFSIPIRAGIFEGDDTPLNLQLINGLHIVLQLAPNTFVLNNRCFLLGAGQDTSGQQGTGGNYQLSNVSLSFEAVVPPPDAVNAIVNSPNPEAFDYVAYTNFYNVLQTTDHTSIMNINTSRTIGFTCNMIPSAYVNNYDFNSSMTLPPVKLRAAGIGVGNAQGVIKNQVPIKEITYTRGGVRMPLDFVINAQESQDQQTPDGQLQFTTLNNIQKVFTRHHLLKSTQTELGLPMTDEDDHGRSFNEPSKADNVPCFDVGVSFDQITENGINFKGMPLGMRIQTDFGSDAVSVLSLYLYIKHKNTIMFGSNGAVQVQN